MSKILFTIAFYHDAPTKRPQFIISTNNLYSIQLKGTDFKGVKIGNSNLNNGFRHRFEYSVSGGKSVTRLSLVMNTSAILPHLTWATPHPFGPPKGEGPRGPHPDKEDDKRVSRHSPSGRSHHHRRHHHHDDDDGRRRRRRHNRPIDDGNAENVEDGGFDDTGGYD